MQKSALIEKFYLDASKGIKATWLENSSTKWYDYISDLPVQLKNTYIIVVLHNQVFNGGFHQYFVNGYGQFAQETITALLDIGALKRSSLLKQAYEIVNSNRIPARTFRKQLLDKQIKPLFITDELYGPLDELDNEYYNVIDEEIEELLYNYLTR